MERLGRDAGWRSGFVPSRPEEDDSRDHNGPTLTKQADGTLHRDGPGQTESAVGGIMDGLWMPPTEDRMASRLDELHGHQYTTQRVVNALVRLDPDPGRKPSRAILPVLVGLVVTALVMVAVPIWGELSGHNAPSDLRDTSSVLVEKESGAQFVYTKADDQLHPVLNYTSGLLVSDGDGGDPVMVNRRRLAELRQDSGIAIGATLGIEGAPNALPRPDDLTRDPWQVCTRAGDQTDVFVGAGSVHDGHVLAGPSATGPGEALLVKGPVGSDPGIGADQAPVYLIFQNHKLSLRGSSATRTALGWSAEQAQSVSAAFLNTVPLGPDLVAPAIAGIGTRSRAVPDVVGRRYWAPGNGNAKQWAVVLRDRVEPITDVQQHLLSTTPGVGEAVEVSIADFARLPGIGLPVTDQPPAGLPTLVPNLATMSTAACAEVPDATAGVASIQVDPAMVAAAPAVKVTTDPAVGTGDVASRIGVLFGHGVLVRSAASPTAPAGSGAISIITDSGIRYPVPDQASLTKLGYGTTTPFAVPSTLVDLFPVGPPLSISAASRSH